MVKNGRNFVYIVIECPLDKYLILSIFFTITGKFHLQFCFEINANISILSVPDYRTSGNSVPTSDVIPGGSTAPAERQIYSGERRLLGVATMHKSNMVPVFDSKDAKDIARMRRN